jgi:hypothetical protein
VFKKTRKRAVQKNNLSVEDKVNKKREKNNAKYIIINGL